MNIEDGVAIISKYRNPLFVFGETFDDTVHSYSSNVNSSCAMNFHFKIPFRYEDLRYLLAYGDNRLSHRLEGIRALQVILLCGD